MNAFQKSDTNNFVQRNSLDEASKHALRGKDFLQSHEWRKFQESVGHRTFNVSGDNFRANIIEHKLPIVGRYFYIPRWPEARNPKSLPCRQAGEIPNSKQITYSAEVISATKAGQNSKFKTYFSEIINLARKNKAGWIRIDIDNSRTLDLIRDHWRAVKAPHDTQARQVFVIDISKTEEELLARMKPKARYNIRLSQKRGVFVKAISKSKIQISNQTQNSKSQNPNHEKYLSRFLELIKLTSKRNKIKSHPENYYRKMLETIPGKNLKLYAAEYQGKIIAANLVSFYGDTATYLHGASDNKYRNVMAPFLLQWRAMLDAKEKGCKWYDMGGVKMQKSKCKNQNDNEKCKKIKKSQATSYPPTGRAGKLQANKWSGITRFKLGFSPKTKPVEFPGSYDIVISPWRYWIYRAIQLIKSFVK